MSSSLTVQVGTFTSSPRAFSNTDANIANIIQWAMEDKITPPPADFTTAQRNQYYLDAYRDELIRYTMQEAYKNRRRDLAAASNVDATAAADTAL